MTTTPYKHIIFDLDRTLWDFERAASETLADLFNLYLKSRCSVSLEHFVTVYKKINESLWDAYRTQQISKDLLRTKRFQITLNEIGVYDNLLGIKLGDLYVSIIANKVYLLPYAIELLEYLQPRYSMSIMTNGFKEVQYPKIKQSGIGHYFSHTFISEEIGFNKPDIRIFEYAIQTLGLIASEILFVGDDWEVDILGASRAGMDQVFFNPVQRKNKVNGLPTYSIVSLKELTNIL